MSTIRSDFDRIAALSDPGWNHNNAYHAFLLRESPAARAAWDEHGRHDSYLTMAEVRRACARVLPGARVTKHLFWRYSIVWRKTGA